MVIVLMGVTGSGKTTIGRLLSEKLQWRYYDADDFHPQANVKKMKDGIPLNDEDRRPWLESLNKLIRECLDGGENAALGCSALKESYREYLLVDERVKLVYLKGDYETIQRRLSKRRGHFMNPELLESQFETLEEPEGDVRVDVSLSPAQIVESIRSDLGI
ncbi:MAG: gluconokinase [Acidobacteriota bacterium]|jgi:gluconokinase|nr:gluconokinase [Acidobacteriota bacterium]